MDEEFGEFGESYHLYIKENYSEVDIYYDRDLYPYYVGKYMSRAEWLCAEIQLFSGIDDWYVTINVYNSKTGKLVATGDNKNNNVSYDEEDWKRSEEE